jgi:hypothetical protein
MKVCIASKNRAETMTTHLFFKSEDVLIFVEPQEIQKYQLFWPDYKFVNIKENDKGLVYVRNFILDYVDFDKLIIADDDLSFGYRLTDGHYSILSSGDDIFLKIEKLLDIYTATTLTWLRFAYFINKSSNNKKYFINSHIVPLIPFGGINKKFITDAHIRFDESLTNAEGEYIDFTIQHLVHGAKIYIDMEFACLPTFKNTGGLQQTRGTLSQLFPNISRTKIIENLLQKYGSKYITSRGVKYDKILEDKDIILKKLNERNS